MLILRTNLQTILVWWTQITSLIKNETSPTKTSRNWWFEEVYFDFEYFHKVAWMLKQILDHQLLNVQYSVLTLCLVIVSLQEIFNSKGLTDDYASIDFHQHSAIYPRVIKQNDRFLNWNWFYSLSKAKYESHYFASKLDFKVRIAFGCNCLLMQQRANYLITTFST